MTDRDMPRQASIETPPPVVIDEARNRRIGWYVGGTVAFMLAASYAAVPLYEMFCRATGYGGTPMVATAAPKAIGDRVISIRFDANVAGGLGWQFQPEVAEIKVRVGEVKTVSYTVKNPRSEATTGIASFNVTPEQTGAFFNKISCFCFTEQTLGPGESRTEEVVFFIDPDISKEKELDPITSITLSYTFFPAKNGGKPLADAGQLTGSRGARETVSK